MCKSVVTLAETPGLGHVRLCSCGCVQLGFGPVTIRLEAAALSQAVRMLQNAEAQREQLAARSEDPVLTGDWPTSGTLVH